MKYIITDGENYIKYVNNKESVTKDMSAAHKFENEIKASNVIKSIKVNKILSKYKWYIDQVKEKAYDDIIEDEDFEESNNNTYNQYNYTYKTIMENENFNLEEFMITAIKVFSQLPDYIQNMSYLQRDTELKIHDFEHYERDEDTKMNAICAQSYAYLTQEFRRERIIYKRNKKLASVFLKDINRIKDTNYVNVINNIMHGEYKYRRISKEEIERLIRDRKKNNLKVV